MSDFFSNIATGLAPVLAWNNTMEGIFLAPLLSLPTFALTLIGLFSTTKGFFASRNSIATLLLVFCLIITGFNPNAVVFFILPLAILVAHGLKYLLEKWYGLFPENPYARISALFPLTVLFAMMIIPSLLQYIYGYRYCPNVVRQFSENVRIIKENLDDTTLLVQENYDFYKMAEINSNLHVVDRVESGNEIAVLGKLDNAAGKYELTRIITSPMSDNSDIIYLYRYKGEQNGTENGPSEITQPTTEGSEGAQE